MADYSTLLAAAIEHHRAGRLDPAEQLYRQILAADPNHFDALQLLGVIAFTRGRLDVAAQYIAQAIALHGTEPSFHSNLGNIFQAQRKWDQAAACYRRAVELKPDFAEAHNNLGTTLRNQNKTQEAINCFRRALAVRSDYAEAYSNLGNALLDAGCAEEAISAHRQAVQLRPDVADIHNNLGVALRQQEQVDEAIAAHRRALELWPDFAEAHNNLGTALRAQGKLDEALACHRRALELKPDYAEALGNSGNILKEQGKVEEAIACHRRAVALRPDLAELHNNLGAALKDKGELDEAVACHRRAITLRPNFADGYTNLGAALWDLGEMDQAVTAQRLALSLKPGPQAHSNLLLTQHYCQGLSPADFAAAHAAYERQHAAPLYRAWQPHENDPDPDRRLRLGFVSPDFGMHPVGFFLIRLLENIDRRACEAICYSDRIIKDDLTVRFQAAANSWCEVNGVSDRDLAARIRDDRVDILFDLAGHTAKNRLLVFARKPAPVQVTWLGYPDTTGLKAIDYLLADIHEVPPGAEIHYAEQVLRLPDGYLCYDPPAYAPVVGSLPAFDNGYVTFGSLNNPAKLNPQVIELWARVLSRVPRSRLLLKYKGMNEASVNDRLSAAFAGHGIDPERITRLPWSRHAVHLDEYNRIDIALDPFPYSGGLTTCEALWMGVPVVTCPGETFASRHSFSHLMTVGLPETIAENFDEYVDLAVRLAGDLTNLAALRGSLRERMRASPLCDGKRLADNLLHALRKIWRQWCSDVE